MVSLAAFVGTGCNDKNDGEGSEGDSDFLIQGTGKKGISKPDQNGNSNGSIETPGDENTTDQTTSPECATSGFKSIYDYASYPEPTKPEYPRAVDYVAIDGFPQPDVKFNLMQIEARQTGSATATEPGVYSLDGQDYSTCKVCPFIVQGCQATAENACPNPEKVYLADEGTIDISSISSVTGENFTAILSDVKFHEIDQETGRVKSGGDTWCLNSYSFDAMLINPVSLGKEVEDFKLQNCGSESLVASSKYVESDTNILWVMNVTGWCTACGTAISAVNAEISTLKTEKKTEVMYVLTDGLTQGKPADLAYCKEYATAHDIPLEKIFIDPKGVLFAHLNPYTDDTNSIALPWNGLIDTNSREYLWYQHGWKGMTTVKSAIEANSTEATP